MAAGPQHPGWPGRLASLLRVGLTRLGVPMGRDDRSRPLKRHCEFRAKVERHRQHEDEPSPAWEGV
jgi:hypothetical protein